MLFNRRLYYTPIQEFFNHVYSQVGAHLCKAMKSKAQKTHIELVLLDIRSTYNVGAMFRTADAIGVSKIQLVGITPAPKDRFGRPRSDIAKAALGAEQTVPWEYTEKISLLLLKYKKAGFQIIVIEQSETSVDYKKVSPKGKVAVIMGNEVGGVPEKILKKCDIIAEIPMMGTKESLNVSVSCGIALFGMFDK